ncbi:DUF262 domain-containing protein [Dickeya chrysanthemi]|uniref:DUF262 domain-containing protein n=1 Tax=Dickeya chrysanthemi TaxID=556 RepID=UPI0025A2EEE2|nr:DUF262 domain-containing protein [Dickeya chrysanthemi]WJM85163.1 DUF262 domain-containing protein [Dickeya chrysanthemi]
MVDEAIKQNDEEELKTEDEHDDVPFVEFDITVSPSDPTLELLVTQIQRQDVIIPFYQRRYVWNIEQASRLIESFLMGLPVPQIFLYVNDDDQMEVIDGQQRILSVKYFMEGYFGEPDARGRRQIFELKGLSERSAFNGKTFDNLPLKEQRKLRNSTLRAINIKQLKPSNRNDSVFHIFERLNTGGTQLKPQEIRNAVYRGNIVSELQHLNDNATWQSILGLKKKDKNQKDVELILRLFSLYKMHSEYEKPMLKFLNYSMKENSDFNTPLAVEFKHRFPMVLNLIVESIEKPFRPKGILNSASLEGVFIALLEMNSLISREEFIIRYNNLMNNEEFKSIIIGSTTDTLILKRRIMIAKSFIENGFFEAEDNDSEE